MKNRFFFIFIIGLMSISFVACGSENNATPETNTQIEATEQATPEQAVEVAPMETTEAVEPVETETTEPETTDTIAPEETQTEATEQKESSQYTFTDMDEIKYAKTSVNVRNLPDTSGDKLGGLAQNDEIHITGQCNETGWFRFDYNNSIGYVSNSYIVDEKVEITQAPSQSNSGNSNSSSIDGIPAVTWGDGAGNPSNAVGYLATIGYDFNTIYTDSEGRSYYYVLCCTTRDGGGGYDAHLIGNGSVTQERINGSLRIYINNVQYSVERVTSH